jgi:hypothetical protein
MIKRWREWFAAMGRFGWFLLGLLLAVLVKLIAAVIELGQVARGVP